MSPEKASVTVRIAGEEHTIRASAEPEYTKRCAKLVDDHIHEIRVRAGLIEGHRAAILAALSIADQCFQAVDELEQVRKETASRATDLTRRIEAELPEQTGDD
mgnify:FL=1